MGCSLQMAWQQAVTGVFDGTLATTEAYLGLVLTDVTEIFDGTLATTEAYVGLVLTGCFKQQRMGFLGFD